MTTEIHHDANPVRNRFADMSAHDQRAIVALVEGLRTSSLAAHASYDEAAAEVRGDHRLRDFLRALALERLAFAGELGDLLVGFGAKAGPPAAFKSSLHRAWIDLRAFLEGHDPVALLSECERGEQAALDAYETALKRPLSLDVEAMLLDHASAIREARAGLDRMRHPW